MAWALWLAGSRHEQSQAKHWEALLDEREREIFAESEAIAVAKAKREEAAAASLDARRL